jgi:transposase-like protein
MALSRRFGLAVYRFPLEIIQQAIWLYVRFTLSISDVEDLLAERGIMVSYELSGAGRTTSDR